MTQLQYRVGDLRRIVQESAQEFEAKLGPGVKQDNKKNNEKSYKDAEKAAKDFDGGLKEEPKGKLPDKMDGNRTVLDYNPRTAPSKEFKEKVDAQAKGYTSKLEEDNGIPKVGEFDNDGKLKKNITDASDKMNDIKTDLENSGIQGNNLKDINPKKETMYESTKPVAKRLIFKHTKFLNESQMLQRVPEEYKKDGQKIYMQDVNGNEYLVECSKSENSGFIEMNVVSHKNEKLMNEQVSRIEELMNYKTSSEFGPRSNKERLEEGRNFQDIMDIARGKKEIM